MKRLTNYSAEEPRPAHRRVYILLALIMTAILSTALFSHLHQNVWAADTSRATRGPTPTPTAVVLTAIVSGRGATIWNTDGNAVQTLVAGANLTTSSRSSDGQWLYVQSDAGASGWVAAGDVIAVNVATLPTESISLAPVTPTAAPATATPAPTADTAMQASVPATQAPPPAAVDQAAAAPAAPVQVAAADANGRPTVRIATSSSALNVRAGPGMDYAVITKAPTGAEYVALSRNEAADWVQIEIGDTAYGFGWVAARYLFSATAINDLPVSTSIVAAPVAAAPVTAINTGPTGLSGKLVIQQAWGGDIYLYDLGTGDLRLLTGGFDPSISPDGSKVVFTRIGGENGIYVINSDGTDEHQIFAERSGLFAPKWSPDGNWIVFIRTDYAWKCRDLSEDAGRYQCIPDSPGLVEFDLIKEYRPRLARIDANGGNYRDVAGLDTAGQPDWNNAGITYSSAAGIQITSDASQDANRLVTFDEFKKYYMDPDWQPGPEGTPGRIAFQRREASRWEIFSVNPDGSGFTALTRPATTFVDAQPSNVSPAWSPDGQQIVFLSNRDQYNSASVWRLWVMNADGSNQHPLPVDLPFQYQYVGEQMVDWGR